MIREFLQSTRIRLLAWVLLPVVMVLSLTLATAWTMLSKQQQQTIDGHLSREASELKVLSEKAVDPATGARFSNVQGLLSLYIQRTVPDPNETMFVLVEGYVTERTTDSPPIRLDQDKAFIDLVNATKVASFGNYETSVGNARYIVVPIQGQGDYGALVGVIFSDLESLQITELLYRFAMIVLLALIAAIAVGWLVTGRALRPILQIRQTAHEIGETDLSKRIEKSSGGTELNQLVAEFNLMLDRIEESFAVNRGFVDDAGHELRTPLTIISGHLELMEADPSQEATSMRIVKDELARMSRIVKDLQTLTKSSQPDFILKAPTNLQELGDELFVKASQLADRNWQVGEIGPVMWDLDRERITQGVLQLAENATRFTETNGIIKINIEPGQKDLLISVSDSGPGIAPEDRARLSERFVRGSQNANSGQGAGLGLAVVSAIAKGHGGELDISDSEFGGAKISIKIPRS